MYFCASVFVYIGVGVFVFMYCTLYIMGFQIQSYVVKKEIVQNMTFLV